MQTCSKYEMGLPIPKAWLAIPGSGGERRLFNGRLLAYHDHERPVVPQVRRRVSGSGLPQRSSLTVRYLETSQVTHGLATGEKAAPVEHGSTDLSHGGSVENEAFQMKRSLISKTRTKPRRQYSWHVAFHEI